MKFIPAMLMSVLILILNSNQVNGQERGYGPDINGVLYVNEAATGNSAGDRWKDAIPQLADALRIADSLNKYKPGGVKEIWVARGTYKPMFSAEDGKQNEDGGRNNSFVMVKDVKLYGGFSGIETSLHNRDSAKLFTDNKTLLSGDLGEEGNLEDNSYHVVISQGANSSVEMEGFIIKYGNANGTTAIRVNGALIEQNFGGGLFNQDSHNQVFSCQFSENFASELGGAVFNRGGNIILTNSIFTGNQSFRGGAFYSIRNTNGRNLDIQFIHCHFKNNRAPGTTENSSGGAIYNNGCTLTITRSEFTSNSAYSGGAITNLNSDNLYISQSSFSRNEAKEEGGAIYNKAIYPATISESSFKENTASKGGAIAVHNSQLSAINSTFSGNEAINWGGAIYENASANNYIGSLFSGNKANYGGGLNIDNSSASKITQCTIAGNSAKEGGGGLRIYNSNPVIQNSIIWGNSDAISNSSTNLSISYSIVQSSILAGQGENNLSQDPLFKEPVAFSKAPATEGNYELQTESPAEDWSDPQINYANMLPAQDLAGNSRNIGWYPDAGAYEIQKFTPDNNGILYVKDDANGTSSGNSWANAFHSLSMALLAAQQINDGRPGTIKQIWVAKGIQEPYLSAEDGRRTEEAAEKSAFVLVKNVKLFGGFAGTESQLSQRDTGKIHKENKTVLAGSYKSYHVVIATGDLGSAEINGFEISEGLAREGSSMTVNKVQIRNDNGGALYIKNTSALVIANCIIMQNHASGMGAGIYNENSSLFISNTSFQQNTGEGSALFNQDARFQLTACNFLENEGVSIYSQSSFANISYCSFSGNEGGSIYNDNTSGAVSYCIFSNNHARMGAGIYNYQSSPSISHSTFTENNSNHGGAIYNEDSQPSFLNCSFLNNKASYVYQGRDDGNGGAIYNWTSSPSIINSNFTGNQTSGLGGAIINNNGSSPNIAGCLFTENNVIENTTSKDAGGNTIYNLNNSNPTIVNTTITHYSTGKNYEVYNRDNSSPAIVNTIIWGNDKSMWTQNSTAPQVTYSIIQQPNGVVWKGDGNMNKNPDFMSVPPSDYAKGNYRLSEKSPAIAAGTTDISKYQLPEADIDGSPLLANGKINIGAYSLTFTQPQNLVATYDNQDSIIISWKAILPTGQSHVGGDNFKLERSVDSTFKNNVKLITSSYPYDPKEVNYSIEDDISDIRGGTRVYYRLLRTAAENQSWAKYLVVGTNIEIVNELKGLSAQIISKEGEAPKVRVAWEKLPGVWPAGTTFTLKKKNTTTGTEDAISIKKEQAREGFYIDDNIPACKEITYTISVALGNNFTSPADADVPDTILTSNLSPITNLTASKGYFRDRTGLKWSSGGSYDHYLIKRSVYGLNDFEQIETVAGANLQNLQTNDLNGTPGVYYEYEVTGMVKCGSKTLYSQPVVAIGFTSPTGTVYGRVTYENGGGAVQNATVRMESTGESQLGKSLYLTGESALMLDSLTTPPSDTALTFEAWIKPSDTRPANQIIFTQEGSYEIGFNEQGKLYFDYYGNRATGDYVADTTDGFIHIAAIYNQDSVMLMLNDKIIGQKAVSNLPEKGYTGRYYMGGASDGFGFKGFLDEVRFWNTALSAAQVSGNYTRLLTGGENGLIAYWQFNAAVKDQFFDISHQGEKYHQNDGFMNPQHAWYSNTIPSANHLSLKAFTDSIGNYTITGIPYMGVNGTTYNIGPVLGTHLFDPVAVTRIFAAGSNTFTVDFKDKSSYTVSGYVTYQNTTVPVKGVQFKIDGNFAFTGNGGISQTDDEGYFEISVPVGEHEVRAEKANHVFVNNGKITDINGNNYNYQNSLANVKIYDSTKIRFVGRIAGGAIEADYPVGFSLSKNILSSDMRITLKLSSDKNYSFNTGAANTKTFKHVVYSSRKKGSIELPDSTTVEYKRSEIVIYPDTLTGEFQAELIPTSYKISDIIVKGYDSPLSGPVLLDLTDSVITQPHIYERADSTFNVQTGEWSNFQSFTDTAKYNVSSVFPIYMEPTISVKQTIDPGNPNTVEYFGSTGYSYTTMGGETRNISLYNEQSASYTFGYPVFQQNLQYGLKIASFESYPFYDKSGSVRHTTLVPSQGGLITINNRLKTGSSAPDTLSIQTNGTAYYTFTAGEPELTDGIGLKGYSVSVKIGGKVYEWNKGNQFESFIFGGRPIGKNFVTTGPQELIGILRDPPGSKSYSYIKKGSTDSRSWSYSTTYNTEGSISTEISTGPTFKQLYGIGVATETELKTILQGTITAVEETNWLRDSIFVTSTTFETGFQTSDDPSFVGASADVFIGRATDITYGAIQSLIPVPTKEIQQGMDVVFFYGPQNGYSIVQRTGLSTGQNFRTLFAYPQYFIIDNLIPDLIKIRNSILAESSALTNPQAMADAQEKLIYVSKIEPSDSLRYGVSNSDETIFGNQASKKFGEGPGYTIYYPRDDKGNPKVELTDTILTLNQHIAQWKHWLKKNEKDKIEAQYKENYSVSSGAAIDYSISRTSDTSYHESFDWVLNAGLELKTGFKINSAGIILTTNITGGGGGGSTSTNETGTFNEAGYHLELDGADYLSVDVGKDMKDNFVFRTKGGVTSCPYEGASFTQYYNPGTPLNQPTVQREMPQITVDKPIVSGIAENRSASYTVHLQNASTVKGDIFFGLKVIDKSNPNGARVYLDGSPLGSGRDVLIPSGEKITKTITLEAGPDSLDYENIQLVLHSTCQYNPQVYSTNIGDTISISAHFLPACSDIQLALPSNQWLLNTTTALNEDGYPYLPVKIDKYDLNKSSFNHIALQYKAATSPDWVTVSRFFTDSSTYKGDKQGGAKEVIQSAEKINYNLVMNPNFSDGQYDIRAVSVCMDNGQVIAQTPSETARGIKDTYAPRLFGNPQPANGVLGMGDDIKLMFNETLDAGFLNNNNFTVKAVKNGTALDSLVAVQLDGQKDFVQTEFSKNLMGKSFTVEMWMMPDDQQQGTLFSHGSKNETAELALTPDYFVEITLGNKTYKSDKPLEWLPSQWVHIAMVYNLADSSVSIFYNFMKIFEVHKAGAYKGNGPLVFAKSVQKEGDYFPGKIRNVRVWTQALSALQLQTNSSRQLSGGENNLLACYPMSEGKGNILTDKAHGNNASFTGQWKLPSGKSVEFNGTGYVKLNTGQAVITDESDFTLSVWFKAQTGQTNATILSSGKGDGSDHGSSAHLFFLGFENGKLTFKNNSYEVIADDQYIDNNWHNVVIAANRNTGTAQFYVDGKLQKFFDAGNLGGLASAFTYVGARAFRTTEDSATTQFDQYFKGNIDEVRIWNTYLNSTLITKDDNERLSGRETGLLAWYPFEKHVNFNGIWSTEFTAEDQKVQKDVTNVIDAAVLKNAAESNDKAPIKNAGPQQDLSYDFVVNNDAIVINFTGGPEQRKAIDKTIVTFTATDIKDMHGNLMVSPVTWTAYIDRNPLKWSDEALHFSKKVFEPLQFELYISNTGGNDEQFTLNNLPPWLTANMVSGTVPPQGKQKIIFNVNNGLNVGSYDNIIEMNNSMQEMQSLALNIKVNGETPDWTVSPEDFKYNMSVYGKIRIKGLFSHNEDDMLAAFINGKCVGVTNNTYLRNNDLWYTLLTVYNNDLQNKNIEFRIWDASTGKMYSGIPSRAILFANDTIAGSPREPVIFDGMEITYQNINLVKGWNWLSINVADSALSNVKAALANGNWSPGDIVKHDERGFDQYSKDAGWVGTLKGFDNTSLFKLYSGRAQILSISGTLVNVKETPIVVRGNRWSFISYLPQTNMTLKEALANYNATEGDVIKSQTGFAMYDERLGWVGTLTYLEPGQGYMMFRKVNADESFVYPAYRGSFETPRFAGSQSGNINLNNLQLPVENNYNFSDNMNIIATVESGFTMKRDDKILAYAGNEIRGKAVAIYNPVIKDSSFFFNISGKEQEPVYFVIERESKIIAKTKPVVAYITNNLLGTLPEPFTLIFQKIKKGAQEITIYPNPFKHKVDIYVNTEASYKMQMLVYNTMGQLMFAESQKQVNGNYHTLWNGKTVDGGDCTPGIYFIHIVINGVSHIYKVIKN